MVNVKDITGEQTGRSGVGLWNIKNGVMKLEISKKGDEQQVCSRLQSLNRRDFSRDVVKLTNTTSRTIIQLFYNTLSNVQVGIGKYARLVQNEARKRCSKDPHFINELGIITFCITVTYGKFRSYLCSGSDH